MVVVGLRKLLVGRPLTLGANGVRAFDIGLGGIRASAAN